MRQVLKSKRKALGLTQRQVAHELGITIRAYQYIESGQNNPSWARTQRLEKLLNTPASELLKVTKENNTEPARLNRCDNIGKRNSYAL